MMMVSERDLRMDKWYAFPRRVAGSTTAAGGVAAAAAAVRFV